MADRFEDTPGPLGGSTATDEQAMADRLIRELLTKLEANRHKRHWLEPDVRIHYLLGRLREETEELLQAVLRDSRPADVWAEAADVAAFAGMIADLYDHRACAGCGHPIDAHFMEDEFGLEPCSIHLCQCDTFERRSS